MSDSVILEHKIIKDYRIFKLDATIFDLLRIPFWEDGATNL